MVDYLTSHWSRRGAPQLSAGVRHRQTLLQVETQFLTTSPRDHAATDQHVAFAGELARWVERAGVTDADAVGDLAVGFADILNAAAIASRELDELLTLDPTDPAGADAVLTKLGYLYALFITEIKSHAEDLDRRWETLEGCVAARAPNDAVDAADK